MPTSIGNMSVYKVSIGDLYNISKISIGEQIVYSAGNIVTYIVDENTIYQEEVDEGASCLSPTSFTVPGKSGYIFAGWSLESGGNALTALVMGDEPITLYAVWVVNAFNPILNGVLQAGYYISATRINTSSYGGYDLPNPAVSNTVYGHYGHNGANGANYGDSAQGAMVTFYTRGCSKVQITPFLSPTNQYASGSLVVYCDGIQLYNSNTGSSTITINVLGYSSVQVIFKASSNQSTWLAGGIQTITCS